jgi:hypothetical protein
VVNKRQLHVIGLVIDNRSGYIANGFRAVPEKGMQPPTGIPTSSIIPYSSSTYDLQGRRVADNSPAFKSGLYIIKTPNHQTKKIISK